MYSTCGQDDWKFRRSFCTRWVIQPEYVPLLAVPWKVVEACLQVRSFWFQVYCRQSLFCVQAWWQLSSEGLVGSSKMISVGDMLSQSSRPARVLLWMNSR